MNKKEIRKKFKNISRQMKMKTKVRAGKEIETRKTIIKINETKRINKIEKSIATLRKKMGKTQNYK